MLNARGKTGFDRATLVEVETFLRVKEDKRRALLNSWGLGGMQSVAWRELWACLGLDQDQPERIHKELKEPLLLPIQVAAILGLSVDTVNIWCRTNAYPKGFPRPIRLGARKKAWLSLEIMAYRNPDIYGSLARRIRRSKKKPSPPERPKITLDPDLSVENLVETSSAESDLAKIQSIDPVTDGCMLQDLDQLVATIEAAADVSLTLESSTMDTVIQMLDAEIHAGEARSLRARRDRSGASAQAEVVVAAERRLPQLSQSLRHIVAGA